MILQNAYQILFSVSLYILAFLILCGLIRAIRGPRIADRIVAINMISTLVIAMICILAVLKGEGYLVDVALIYSLLGFLAVVVLCKVFIGIANQRKPSEEKEALEDQTPIDEVLPIQQADDCLGKAVCNFFDSESDQLCDPIEANSVEFGMELEPVCISDNHSIEKTEENLNEAIQELRNLDKNSIAETGLSAALPEETETIPSETAPPHTQESRIEAQNENIAKELSAFEKLNQDTPPVTMTSQAEPIEKTKVQAECSQTISYFGQSKIDEWEADAQKLDDLLMAIHENEKEC